MATTTLAGTTANDILNAPGSVTTEVAGKAGNDTITLVKTGDIAMAGAGADSITITLMATRALFAAVMVQTLLSSAAASSTSTAALASVQVLT